MLKNSFLSDNLELYICNNQVVARQCRELWRDAKGSMQGNETHEQAFARLLEQWWEQNYMDHSRMDNLRKPPTDILYWVVRDMSGMLDWQGIASSLLERFEGGFQP